MIHHSVKLRLETLDSRTLPSVTLINPKLAEFTDVDGDRVQIQVSNGTLTPQTFGVAQSGLGDQLQLIDFSGGGFDGTNLKVGVVEIVGDGLVHVGYINSTGHNLGKVEVQGDLGQIDAGAGSNGAGLRSLKVDSMGRFGTTTQAAGGNLECVILGDLGALDVRNDVNGQYFNIDRDGDATAKLGVVRIGGSLIGGDEQYSGLLFSTGAMGRVDIAGDIVGAAGRLSGYVTSNHSIRSVTIGGSIIGGVGEYSANIYCQGNIGKVRVHGDLLGGIGIVTGRLYSSKNIQSVSIGGDFRGGSEVAAGLIQADGRVGRISIGGSLLGGSGRNSGQIYSPNDIGPITIGEDIRGGSAEGTGEIAADGKLRSIRLGGSLVGGPATNSGIIFCRGRMGPIGIDGDLVGASMSGTMSSFTRSGLIECFNEVMESVTIGGSIISGVDTSAAGELTENASIRSGYVIKKIHVKGNLVGNRNPDGDAPVVISAGNAVDWIGRVPPVFLGSLRVDGNVERTKILIGYNSALEPFEPDCQVNSVLVGGNWIASSLVVGADAVNGQFGDGDDIAIDTPMFDDHQVGYRSKLGKLTIQGSVSGTPAAEDSTDFYGIVAQQIGSVRIGGQNILLASGPSNDLSGALLGQTEDVRVIEIA